MLGLQGGQSKAYMLQVLVRITVLVGLFPREDLVKAFRCILGHSLLDIARSVLDCFFHGLGCV